MCNFKWKSFDFGPETSVDEKKSSPKRKRTKTASNENIADSFKIPMKKANFNFQKMIIPESTAELAVHPKKIQEIEGWIKFALNSSEKVSIEINQR